MYKSLSRLADNNYWFLREYVAECSFEPLRNSAQWQRYEGLIRALQQSEAMIDPVLAELKSNVVYFKQTLDEASVAARKTELVATDSDIEVLIGALTNAVTQSDEFLKAMQ